VHWARRYGRGHVNDTFLVVGFSGNGNPRRLLMQRLATVFAEPAALMANVAAVTARLRHALASGGPVRYGFDTALELLADQNGEPWVIDDEGRGWRAYEFVPQCRSLETASDVASIELAGRAFGGYLAALSEPDPLPLAEHLPRFHDLAARRAALDDVTARAPDARLHTARHALAAARGLTDLVARWKEAMAAGMPKRPVHYDCKLNNLLFAHRVHRVRCVVDLDTTMPGFAIADFGDLVRTTASSAPEDAFDPRSVRVDPERVGAAARGWLQGCGHLLHPAERVQLIFGAQWLAYETGLRFLTDFLEGDRYFRVRDPMHNLRRALAQFALAHELCRQEHRLEAVVEQAVEG
jgi:hypothetical protein